MTQKTKLSLLALLLLCFTGITIACNKSSNSTTSTETPTSTTASVSALNCSSSTVSASSYVNTSYSATVSVPYTGGNSASYGAGSAIASTGVTGLTATLASGTLSTSGSIVYNVTGTPTTAGTASFAINFGGQSCSFSIAVAEVSNCTTATGVAKLVCLADAFKATLSSSQISTLQLAYSFSNIKTWSNLPAAMSARLGIKFADLNSTQLAAAKALVQQMSGTVANEGWDEVQQLWLADDYLGANGGGSTYGSGNYYISFFGTPSMSGTFEIMMTGHHKTVANTYKDGVLVAATPHFAAIEPLSFTTNGVTYAPINQEKLAFVAMLASLTTAQLATAKSSSTYSDLLLAPGKDWQFPTTFTGLQCNGLTADQKALVIAAIKTYTDDIDDASAATILAKYTADINNTYITYSGTTALNTRNDYVRIDGPNVWIEFSVQGGIIFSGVHHHSIWRDRVTDYAGTK